MMKFRVGSGALQTLMRQSMTIQAMPIRGGHGWDRPDVPLMVGYEHRRTSVQLSIFDVNLWFYCNVQPEYFINQNEVYLQNAVGGVKQLVIQGRYVLLMFLMCVFTNVFLKNSQIANVQPDQLNNMLHTYPVKKRAERLSYKKHFLDFSVNADNSIYAPSTEQTYIEAETQKFIGINNSINKMNGEAKAYIEKVQNEALKEVLKRRGQH